MREPWDENRWALEESDRLQRVSVLRTAADESARHVRAIYVTYLLFTFYVSVIVFSTTDEQILKETGANLPLLNVELPLLGFYVFIPWLVLLFHAHLINQFFLLSRKLFNLEQELRSLPTVVERVQRELPFPLIFSHRILGAHHPGLILWLFRMGVTVSLVLIPILALLAIQWKFLRYHSRWITFDHQLVITLDLLLVWAFWPRLFARSRHWRVWWPWSGCLTLYGETLFFDRPRSPRQWSRMVASITLTCTLLFGTWALLVPPGGGIERLIGYQHWPERFRRTLVLPDKILMQNEPPMTVLFADHIDTNEEQARIWLEAGRALDLRGRDLRYADFTRSSLWNANLMDARLQGARLTGAVLQRANLSRAQMQGADLRYVNLKDATLVLANLAGADLLRATLENADLDAAQLQGAHLAGAQLQGSVLWQAQLQGAYLGSTNLQGADLSKAKLQDTYFGGAQLQGADLRRAQLQGAHLLFVQMQGAELWGAQLQGASLRESKLQGADLRHARFYGTDFTGAVFSLTDFRGVCSRPVELVFKWLETEDWPSRELKTVLDALDEKGTTTDIESTKTRREAEIRIGRAIDRLTSITFDQSYRQTTIVSPRNTTNMHDHTGLFSDWPNPPDEDSFVKSRAAYRAKLACDNIFIARRMIEYAFGDPALQEALAAEVKSDGCKHILEAMPDGPFDSITGPPTLDGS